MQLTRRQALAAAVAASLGVPALNARTPARIVVVGGGWGGASAAGALARLGHDVTLVEEAAEFVSCPFSNTVLGGFGRMEDITFRHDGLAARGVRVVRARAAAVDADGQTVTLADGVALPWDRLLLSPGIEILGDALEGYDDQAMPHAWKAGAQTLLLRRQLEAMEDGGTVVIAAPANPFRCPPGPYERACLVARWLTRARPRSKVLILDAKDDFSKKSLFRQAWDTLYPGRVEWVGQSMGGTVRRVDVKAMRLHTDFATHQAAVANVIPPQRAGAIAQVAGVADATGWCPVRPDSFESTLVPGIHVIGDACFVGAMPKSAFSANAQAKVAAHAIDALLRDEGPAEPKLINTCYSLAAPDHGFTVAGVYAPRDGLLRDIEGAGGTSPLDASADVRRLEADHARSWFATLAAEAFG